MKMLPPFRIRKAGPFWVLESLLLHRVTYCASFDECWDVLEHDRMLVLLNRSGAQCGACMVN